VANGKLLYFFNERGDMGGFIGPVGGAVADVGRSAILSWRDEARSCELLKKLFHQIVPDSNGNIQPDRERSEAAGISFTLTQLRLDGLVEHSVYHVEAMNLQLSGDNVARVRYFVYNSVNYELWQEKPTDLWLSPPHGWPAICQKEMASFKSGRAIDKEVSDAGVRWLDRNYSRGEKAALSVNPFFGMGFATAGRQNDRKVVERIERLVHRHCTVGAYSIPPERHRLDIDELSFWLTPLRSAVSDQTVLYYLVVLNRRLPLHPKRAVAFRYSIASKKLQWV
jgi:hypothetical protein